MFLGDYLRNAVVAISLLLLILPLGCSSLRDQQSKPQGPYKVVCTVGMVTDAVRQVAGDLAEVEGIIGQGVDPHLFQASRDDVAKLMRADLIFYVGLRLEGKLDTVLKSAAAKGRPVYAVTEHIDPALLIEAEGTTGHYDPHVWMHPGLWIECVVFVTNALIEYDPNHRDTYKANAMAYINQIEELDRYAREAFATIPEKSRVLVTAHDAFNYMAQTYGFEVRGIQGISTESEAGIADINSLVDMLVERDVRAVFVESSVAEKNVVSLVEGAAARGHDVEIGGTLYSDAMGKSGTYEGTYIGMIDHNVTTIVRALGGDAPRGGFQGKLSSR